MGKDKNAHPPAQTRMDQFTRPGAGSRGTGAEMAPGEPTGTSTETEAILKAIKDSKDAVERKVEEVRVDVSLLRQDLRGVADRVTEAEARISTAEDEIIQLRTQVNQLIKSSAILEDRAEDAENRSRRNNLRLVGIPEGIDTQDMTQLIEDWFRSWVLGEALTGNFAVERAHRSLGARPPPGAPPRAIITRILNFRDRYTILRAARKAQDLRFQNSKIMIFPDYSRAVQSRRRSFEEVKQKLRTMNIQYMLLFPARLKVIHHTKTHFFDSPNQAWEWATEEHGSTLSDTEDPLGLRRSGRMRGGRPRTTRTGRLGSRQRRAASQRGDSRGLARGGGEPAGNSQATDLSATPNLYQEDNNNNDKP